MKENKLLIVGIVVMAVVATTAWALLEQQKEIEGTVTVVTNSTAENGGGNQTVSFDVVQDAKTVTAFDFGEMHPGERKTVDFEIRNTGTATITYLKAEILDLPVNMAGSTSTTQPIEPGESFEFFTVIQIAEDALAGTYPLTVIITARG